MIKIKNAQFEISAQVIKRVERPINKVEKTEQVDFFQKLISAQYKISYLLAYFSRKSCT